jgi:serine/threonine protein kinase
MAGVAATVAAVHQRGFVHRDVKPANILAAAGRVVLADLGTAAPADAPHREHFYRYLYPYTPLFAAPELFAGYGVEQGAYRAADVWSIGATLVSVCTGTEALPMLLSPAERTTLVRSFSRVRGRPARDRAFSELRPVLRERLAQLLRQTRCELRPALGVARSAHQVELLSDLLAIDPGRRPCAARAHLDLVELH